VPEVTVFEEIDWNPKPMLHPGMDFQDGVAYYTVPLLRNMVKMGKGKDADPIHYKELNTFVVTSQRSGFWYDEDGLDAEGFREGSQVYQERENRWSLKSVKAFLDGKTEAEDTNALFDTLRSVYTTYVEYADEAYHDIMSLFVMYTYVFRLFESTGYIHFNGTAASGKSRNLSLLDVLGFNSVWASSMSAASLYRKLAGSPGTTLLDETEGWEGERGEELRRILNAGYKDGATAIRTEKGANDRFMPVEYDVYGPKALASINPLDNVIGSRCLVVAMRPAIRELPEFQTHSKEWHGLRDRLYLWAMDNAGKINDLANEWRSEKKARLAPRLMGRQWETTAQFVILADFVGGEEFATQIIEFLNGYFVKQQEALNATDRLRTTLRCLPRVLASKQPHPTHLYSVKDIHEVVSSYMETDATEYFKTKHVTKNLDVLGFRNKVRASGGLRIELNEEAVRHEFVQRRVEPFDEDVDWLAGKVSYQDQPQVVTTSTPADAWWEEQDDES
jgi:hypothetical protein